MQFKIDGESLPVLKLKVNSGENVVCEAGAMSWMDPTFEMVTQAGSFGKMLGRAFTGESMFLNTYHANAAGEIAFSSKFPGSIRNIEVTPGNGIIIQKGCFLCYVGNIENEVFIQKRVSSGIFGGEGFLMRRYHGTGNVFLEIDGSAHEYELAAGECKIINTGYVAAMSESCKMEIQSIKGVKNVLFGGEGLFNTRVTGPGKVIVQSMPASTTAMYLYSLVPHNS